MTEHHGDDHVREGAEHLQTAALELIAAARVFLDVAESLVKEPGVAAAAARTAAGLASAILGGHLSDHEADEGPAEPSAAADPAAPSATVRHIRIQ